MQITENKFESQTVMKINNVVNHEKLDYNWSILKPKLSEDNLYLSIYTIENLSAFDALRTRLANSILLCDDDDKCNIIHYSSENSHQVDRSILGGETFAFANGMDFILTLKCDLENIICATLPVKLYTNSKILFDFITKNSVTAEERLMIDIRCLREAYQSMHINDVV